MHRREMTVLPPSSQVRSAAAVLRPLGPSNPYTAEEVAQAQEVEHSPEVPGKAKKLFQFFLLAVRLQ